MSKVIIDIYQKILVMVEVLIYQNGIYVMGMDLLVKILGVVWKSIYCYFENKDDVVVVVLRVCDVCWLVWFWQECDKVDILEVCIFGMFIVFNNWFQFEGYCGCVFINIVGEVGDLVDLIWQVVCDYKQKLFDYILEFIG